MRWSDFVSVFVVALLLIAVLWFIRALTGAFG